MLFGKWERKDCPGLTDFSEDVGAGAVEAGRKALPAPLVGFLNLWCGCVSGHRQQQYDISSWVLTCCHGNADWVILRRCSWKKRVRITLLHYALFHLELILLRVFKGLFSSVNQGVVPCSLCARFQKCQLEFSVWTGPVHGPGWSSIIIIACLYMTSQL